MKINFDLNYSQSCVLGKAAKFIEELQNQTQNILSNWLEMYCIQNRVKNFCKYQKGDTYIFYPVLSLAKDDEPGSQVSDANDYEKHYKISQEFILEKFNFI